MEFPHHRLVALIFCHQRRSCLDLFFLVELIWNHKLNPRTILNMSALSTHLLLSTHLFLAVVSRCLRVLPRTFHHWLRCGHQLLCTATLQRRDFSTADSGRNRIVVPTERGGGMCLGRFFLVGKITIWGDDIGIQGFFRFIQQMDGHHRT